MEWLKNSSVHLTDYDHRHHLKADCEQCFGLCCVALSFSASEGFPMDKAAGQPCKHLQSDCRCAIHPTLHKRGLKGCISFDCFGAGQKVSQMTYRGTDWKTIPDQADTMFNVFLVMLQLHELLWHLTDALHQPATHSIRQELQELLDVTEQYTMRSPAELLGIDTMEHKDRVNVLLVRTSELVRAGARNKQKPQPKPKQRSSSTKQKRIGRGADLVAADLSKMDLQGAHLRGALLIAANLQDVDLSGADLIGADLRDANVSGADLSQSLFLTQFQISSARGDEATRLPAWLQRPEHWHRNQI
ncbi:pentapeptide repeat-containing protein [Paenibacillus wenxiniae]|uniref:Pentapeptide repeat-containing protein n=1 Tax=Paenibacillus wenxiniae TaxID=1636843 RepID=A0ABW4RQE9_9BACL